jgi:UrcA family protein
MKMSGKFASPLVTNGLLAGMTMALMTIAAPAMADTPLLTDQVSISTANLDLATPHGRAVLERRVNAAINAMCGAPVFGSRDEAEALQACRDEARAAAQPQVKAVLSRASVTVASAR